jgi:hypothetical protein
VGAVVGFKIDLEDVVVRARLRGGFGVGGVLALEGEVIRDADRLRRIEDVTDVDIRGLGLTGGGCDERNSACALPPPPAVIEGNGTTFA